MMRLEIARMCSQQYSMDLLPEEVTDCDGCSSQTARLFSECAKCEIRKCVLDKMIASCAFCADYACQKLERHFENDPAARVRLEAMRRKLTSGPGTSSGGKG
jgi:hypothetical protein